jgi:hypothetical protein
MLESPRWRSRMKELENANETSSKMRDLRGKHGALSLHHGFCHQNPRLVSCYGASTVFVYVSCDRGGVARRCATSASLLTMISVTLR